MSVSEFWKEIVPDGLDASNPIGWPWRWIPSEKGKVFDRDEEPPEGEALIVLTRGNSVSIAQRIEGVWLWAEGMMDVLEFGCFGDPIAWIRPKPGTIKLTTEENKCPKRGCHGNMKRGIAMGQTHTGMGDFRQSDAVCTVSCGGSGKIIPALKCEKCGHSETINNQSYKEDK